MNVIDFDDLLATDIFDTLNVDTDATTSITLKQQIAMFRALKVKYDLYGFTRLMRLHPEIIAFIKHPSETYINRYFEYRSRAKDPTFKENDQSLQPKIDTIDWSNKTEKDIIDIIKKNPETYSEVPSNTLTRSMRRAYIESIHFIPSIYVKRGQMASVFGRIRCVFKTHLAMYRVMVHCCR
jgi:hypothetical protein